MIVRLTECATGATGVKWKVRRRGIISQVDAARMMKMSYVKQVDPSLFWPLHAGLTAKTEAERASSRNRRQLSSDHDYLYDRSRIEGVCGNYPTVLGATAGSLVRRAHSVTRWDGICLTSCLRYR